MVSNNAQMAATTTEYAMVVNVIVTKVGLVHHATFHYVKTNVDIKDTAQTQENACVCQDSKEEYVKKDMLSMDM